MGSTGPTGPGPQLRPTLGDLKSKAQGLGPVLDSRISPNSDLIKLGGMGFMYSIARRKEGRKVLGNLLAILTFCVHDKQDKQKNKVQVPTSGPQATL